MQRPWRVAGTGNDGHPFKNNARERPWPNNGNNDISRVARLLSGGIYQRFHLHEEQFSARKKKHRNYKTFAMTLPSAALGTIKYFARLSRGRCDFLIPRLIVPRLRRPKVIAGLPSPLPFNFSESHTKKNVRGAIFAASDRYYLSSLSNSSRREIKKTVK